MIDHHRVDIAADCYWSDESQNLLSPHADRHVGICRLLFVTLLSPHADAGDMSFTICDFVTFFVHKIFVRDISGVG